MSFLQHIEESIQDLDVITLVGKVSSVVGNLIQSLGPPCELKELVEIEVEDGGVCTGEVVGFKEDYLQIMPYTSVDKIKKGAWVAKLNSSLHLTLSPDLKGRVLNAQGLPIDGKKLPWGKKRSIFSPPPDVLKRDLIKDSLQLGVRSLDSAITVGKGQRMGIFAGPGVGKSVLLSMIAKNSSSNVNVIALIGERGREVKEFIERNLGKEGMQNTILIVATSDDPPLSRIRSVFTATTIAEYFRDQGLDVNLMVDSITRVALAQREIGVSLREPPVTRGFPPSLFQLLPSILERTGCSEKGSITAFYTVLVENDELDDPIAEAMMSLLDGHIILSRKLANQSIFPAIDIGKSVSRLMIDITDKKHYQAALKLREWITLYDEMSDIINIGAYQKGSNPTLDLAISKREATINFLQQGINQSISEERARAELYQLIYDEELPDEFTFTTIEGTE